MSAGMTKYQGEWVGGVGVGVLFVNIQRKKT